MDFHHRLDRLRRRCLEPGRQSAQLQQKSARLRAHSKELLARLADTRETLARCSGQLAHQQPRRALEQEHGSSRCADRPPDH